MARPLSVLLFAAAAVGCNAKTQDIAKGSPNQAATPVIRQVSNAIPFQVAN